MSIILIFLPFCSAHAKQQPFELNSLQSIERHFEGQPFLLMLWSMECAPCHAELNLISKIKQQYPALKLVLVSSDDISQQQQMNSILKSHSLDSIQSWAFSKYSAEQLRYSIDPDWYGELPRNYFYNSQHIRKGFSGKLAESFVISWLASTDIIE